MQERRKEERPREKLAMRGAASLSDYELLMAIIGSGNAQSDVTKIARDVRKLIAEKHYYRYSHVPHRCYRR